MIRRILIYSRDHDRPVKALFADTLKYQNIRVTALDDHSVTFRTAGKKKEVTLPLESILSVSYARGDDGNTLQYAAGEKKRPEQTAGKEEKRE